MKYSLPPSLRSNGRRLEHFVQESSQQKQRLKCVICQDILIQPRQRDCGCRFCLLCLDTKFDNREPFCPGCKDQTSSIQNGVMPDKAIEKEISNLLTVCINTPCPYKCKLKDLFDHSQECEYRETKCEECHESYPYKDGIEHQKRLCKMMKISCEDCGLEMTRKEFVDVHRNVDSDSSLLCDSWRGLCPYGCVWDVQDNIKMHLDSCENKLISCVFSAVGCSRVMARKELEKHVMVDTWHHWVLLVEKVNELRQDNVRMNDIYSENRRRYDLEVAGLKDITGEMTKMINVLRERVEVCENEIAILCGTKENTWKIDNVSKKIDDAKAGRNTHLLSEPFYSGRPGYRIRLKIYPNGDGVALGEYVSVYFVIMKGQFDDEIQWPFRKRVSMSILSQKTGVRDWTVNMMPDINERCYGRPQSDCNMGAGRPRFISHAELLTTGNYLRDDCITVRTDIV